jgi:hypothetical protein
MDRKSRHKIWKLERLLSKAEKLRATVLTKQEQSRVPLEQTFRTVRRVIRCHATAVAAIVISGKPKIDEPLVRAWARTLAYHRIDVENSTTNNDLDEDDGWAYLEDGSIYKDLHNAAKKIYPAIVEDPDYARPQHWWDPDIVHAPESARFTEIFRTAPGWLLEFTRIRLDARVLEFGLPKISAEPIWGVDGLKDFKRWPLLPLGTMAAGGPVPKEADSDLSPGERRFYREMRDRPREEWSRSERRMMSELIKRVPLQK